jgi:hypothetical protein
MDIEYSSRGILFEWNSDKAAENLAKHGVAFEAACEVFFDPFLFVTEEQVVDDEVRDTVIGMTIQWSMLCIVYTIRIGDRFRIISARQATPTERQQYESQ